jgi:hypothetical protein
MKDYFDVWFIIRNHDIDKDRIKNAIRTTFTRRNTPMGDFTFIFDHDFKFDEDKHMQWKAFLNRTNIQLNQPFDQVIEDIQRFLET